MVFSEERESEKEASKSQRADYQAISMHNCIPRSRYWMCRFMM